jgi:hypothetical protein
MVRITKDNSRGRGKGSQMDPSSHDMCAVCGMVRNASHPGRRDERPVSSPSGEERERGTIYARDATTGD